MGKQYRKPQQAATKYRVHILLDPLTFRYYAKVLKGQFVVATLGRSFGWPTREEAVAEASRYVADRKREQHLGTYTHTGW